MRVYVGLSTWLLCGLLLVLAFTRFWPVLAIAVVCALIEGTIRGIRKRNR